VKRISNLPAGGVDVTEQPPLMVVKICPLTICAVPPIGVPAVINSLVVVRFSFPRAFTVKASVDGLRRRGVTGTPTVCDPAVTRCRRSAPRCAVSVSDAGCLPQKLVWPLALTVVPLESDL